MRLAYRLKSAGRAALWHLAGSVLVAAGAAALVWGLWYPPPYDALSGGMHLFGLLVGADLVCGPLLTLVLYTPRKPRSELRRDLGLVGLLQVTALLYGLWTVVEARPVFLAFEGDRFRIVSAADIEPGDLPNALPQFHKLGYGGPQVIAVRVARADDVDFLRSLELSLHGLDPALRPSAWRPYADVKEAVLAKARPLESLKARHPEHAEEIERLRTRTELPSERIGYLPVQGRGARFWTALIALEDARVIGFLPLDGF